MASYEIVFPMGDDETSYAVREMAYCVEHSHCTHEPRPTGRVLMADGQWGAGPAAEFASLYEAEQAMHAVQERQPLPRYTPMDLRRNEVGEVEEMPAHQNGEVA